MIEYRVTVWGPDGAHHSGDVRAISPLHALRTFCFDKGIPIIYAEAFNVALKGEGVKI